MGPFPGEERDSEAVVAEPEFDRELFITSHSLPQIAQGQSYTSVIGRTVLARQDAGHHEDTGICWILSISPPITSKSRPTGSPGEEPGRSRWKLGMMFLGMSS